MQRFRKYWYCVMIVFIGIIMVSCKKEKKISRQADTHDTTVVYYTKDTASTIVTIDTSPPGPSNSRFQLANLYVDKYEYVDGNNANQDPMHGEIVMWGWIYRDSLNRFSYDTVGAVFFESNALYWSHTNSPAPYYNQHNFSDTAAANAYNNEQWRVVSKNNVTDLIYNGGEIPFYLDTVPDVIVRNAGLTLNAGPNVAPNADTIKIAIYDGSYFSNIVEATPAGQVTFGPAVLAQLQATTNRDCTIRIEIIRNVYLTVNGHSYKIGNYRSTQFKVNVI